jgi:hypothetical protein
MTRTAPLAVQQYAWSGAARALESFYREILEGFVEGTAIRTGLARQHLGSLKGPVALGLAGHLPLSPARTELLVAR